MAYSWLKPIAPFRHLLRKQQVDLGSLQTRLTAGVVLTSLVGVGTVTAWMGWRMQQIVLDSHRQRTILVADRLREDVQYYSTMMPPSEALDKVVDHRSTGDLAIWVETQDGELIAQSETLTMGSWQSAGVSAALLTTPIVSGTEIVPMGNWQLVVCAGPLDVAGLPAATLYIANDVTADYQGLQQLINMLLLTSLGLISLLAMAFALYISRALSPIRHLNRLAGQVTADTLDQPLSLETAPTELQELLRTYNLMLARMSKAWGQQKRLVNDISHELRTPLSLVQGYLESTLRRGKNLTPAQREGLEIAAAEASRTTRLLSEILDLARLSNGQGVLNLEPANLSDIVYEAVALATKTQPYPVGQVNVVDLASVVVKVDRQKLRTALVELIENALHYGDPEQPVQVSLEQHTGWATVAVRDYGGGIPNHCQDDIFDPFYRIDEDRSRSSGGTGLGLTLVRSLMEAMGGQVSMQSQLSQGSVFTLHIPT
ncbi:MAG: HAMP domain-containing sensor histidine kinase [Cyanobacteria bacterium J06638_6]